MPSLTALYLHMSVDPSVHEDLLEPKNRSRFSNAGSFTTLSPTGSRVYLFKHPKGSNVGGLDIVFWFNSPNCIRCADSRTRIKCPMYSNVDTESGEHGIA